MNNSFAIISDAEEAHDIVIIIIGIYSFNKKPTKCDVEHKSDLMQSLDFVVNRFLMKLFKTSNYEIICECRNYLCFVYQVSCWQNVIMYSCLNSIVSNRRMIDLLNDNYDVHLFLISN